MSSGRKKPLIKSWDKPRNIRTVKPSRYEKNEASVKAHWRNVTRLLELSYKDDQFWETQSETVRQLVGPVVFRRIAKIFDLPLATKQYEPAPSDLGTPLPSEEFYKDDETRLDGVKHRSSFSMSNFAISVEDEEEIEEEQSEQWSASTISENADHGRNKSKSRSIVMAKTMSRLISTSKSFTMSESYLKSMSKMLKSARSTKSEVRLPSEEVSYSTDDLRVNAGSVGKYFGIEKIINPYFDMLYCNESETDMIKWNSNYKQKAFEVSASDEFSKKAEILTKSIAKDFYDWWVGLGNVEFKSEIKRPEDIEDLFQIWFSEHASHGIMLHPKILPCVLKSIADYVGVPKAACSNVLKRQVASDIYAETSPAHVMAFGTCLPQKMKHIPPKNNTKEMWSGVKIPEDLKSMACVWEDIQHLTSTKEFHKWLEQHPSQPMPPCLKVLGEAGDKKQLFVVPSDYVVKDKSLSQPPSQELALPVSQFSMELKEVLSRLMGE